MKRIINIPHTHSVHHGSGFIGSWTNHELSEVGLKEANNIGINLKEELKENYFIYSSDLKRAHQTALKIGKHLGVTPITERALREINLGSAVGRTSLWVQEHAKPFSYDIDYKCLEDAESTREHYVRVKKFIDTLLQKEEENIIIVSHGGTAGLINAILTKQDVETLNTLRFYVNSGSLSFFEIKDNVTKVYKLGDNTYKKR